MFLFYVYVKWVAECTSMRHPPPKNDEKGSVMWCFKWNRDNSMIKQSILERDEQNTYFRQNKILNWIRLLIAI